MPLALPVLDVIGLAKSTGSGSGTLVLGFGSVLATSSTVTGKILSRDRTSSGRFLVRRISTCVGPLFRLKKISSLS